MGDEFVERGTCLAIVVGSRGCEFGHRPRARGVVRASREGVGHGLEPLDRRQRRETLHRGTAFCLGRYARVGSPAMPWERAYIWPRSGSLKKNPQVVHTGSFGRLVGPIKGKVSGAGPSGVGVRSILEWVRSY